MTNVQVRGSSDVDSFDAQLSDHDNDGREWGEIMMTKYQEVRKKLSEILWQTFMQNQTKIRIKEEENDYI